MTLIYLILDLKYFSLNLKSEVLHYHVGVVIRLEEPVIVLKLVVVNVLEGLLTFIPEVVPALTDVELDSR